MGAPGTIARLQLHRLGTKLTKGGILMDINWAAIAPIIVLALGFVIFCLIDLARHEVKYLPKWVWVLICCLSVPLGGIVYLLVGRDASS